jgi:hypothetical protein
MVTNTVSLLSVRIRSIFTPIVLIAATAMRGELASRLKMALPTIVVTLDVGFLNRWSSLALCCLDVVV